MLMFDTLLLVVAVKVAVPVVGMVFKLVMVVGGDDDGGDGGSSNGGGGGCHD